jgi:hypothetical protein
MVGLLLLTAGSGMVMYAKVMYPKDFPAPCLRGVPHSLSCSGSPLPVCLRKAPVELPATGGSQPAQDLPPLGMAVSMVGLLLLTAGSGMVMYAKVMYPKDFPAPCLRGVPHSLSCSGSPLPVCLRKAPVELPATGGSQPAQEMLLVVVVTKIPVSPSSVPPCPRYNPRDSIPAGL